MDIYIGYDYPNFVKEEPVEIKVGEKIRFIAEDSHEYLIFIYKANEFLEIDDSITYSGPLIVGITGQDNKYYTSKPLIIEKKGIGEYFFRIHCLDKQISNAEPSRIIIKSE